VVREAFGSKLASIYGRTAGDNRLILFMTGPGHLVACYAVTTSGEITDSWFTGASEPCKR